MRIHITDAGGTPDWMFLVEQLALPIIAFLAVSLVALWAMQENQ